MLFSKGLRSGSLLFYALFLSCAYFPDLIASSDDWEKVIVENASCGRGDPYRIFIRKGDPKKVAFALQGGGACWNYSTCMGMIPLTNLRPIEKMKYDEGFYSKDPNVSAISNYTIVFFPYCSGDVHLANHKTNYDGEMVFHMGRANVEKSLDLIFNRKLLALDEIDQLVVFGHSAGALGSLGHLPTFDRYLSDQTKKVVISDSPGLHFGKRFWKKFTNDLVGDFSESLSKVGLQLDPEDGNVAKNLSNYCSTNSGWRVGILQGNRDFVMSTIFGNTTPMRHRTLVMSDDGLLGQTQDPNDNCSSWIYEGGQHTFLMYDNDANKTNGEMSAIAYANLLVTTAFDQTIPNSLPKEEGMLKLFSVEEEVDFNNFDFERYLNIQKPTIE